MRRWSPAILIGTLLAVDLFLVLGPLSNTSGWPDLVAVFLSLVLLWWLAVSVSNIATQRSRVRRGSAPADWRGPRHRSGAFDLTGTRPAGLPGPASPAGTRQTGGAHAPSADAPARPTDDQPPEAY